MDDAVRAFREHLRARGQVLTSQREHLVRKILDWSGHFTAEQVVDWAASLAPAIGRATVYRTLRLLRESGLLQEHEFGPGARLFEAAYRVRHHDHLFCVRCGKIVEFRSERIERLQEEEIRKAGFVAHGHVHRIFGLCAACRPAEGVKSAGAGSEAPIQGRWRPPGTAARAVRREGRSPRGGGS